VAGCLAAIISGKRSFLMIIAYEMGVSYGHLGRLRGRYESSALIRFGRGFVTGVAGCLAGIAFCDYWLPAIPAEIPYRRHTGARAQLSRIA
jgi:hypothetical protein